MTPADLPLCALFERLRLSDLPLGIGEYLLALRALAAGFGLADREALLRLCQTLWARSPEEARLLAWHFDQLVPAAWVPPAMQAVRAAPTPVQVPRPQEQAPPAPAAAMPDQVPKQVPQAPAAGLVRVPAADELQQARAALAQRGAPRFALRGEYLPVTRRQMKQSWRHLREVVRDGPRVELDVDATLQRLAREGTMADPVLMPRRVNRAEVLFLVDWGGSMVPFHDLSRRLLDAAARGGRLLRMQVYYFHDCPLMHLYRDPQCVEGEPVDLVLRRLAPGRAGVLIVSDGGAARGRREPDRIADTGIFLQGLRERAQRVAWLNPLPQARWVGTSASRIARAVPMFEFSRQGLDRAIDLLRGRIQQRQAP